MARVGPQRHRKKKLLTAFGLTPGGTVAVVQYEFTNNAQSNTMK